MHKHDLLHFTLTQNCIHPRISKKLRLVPWNNILLSDIRVDIPSIRNLLSVTSYQSLANQKPDGVLYARTIGFGSSESNQKFTTSNSRLGRLKKFEKATGYNVSTKITDKNPRPVFRDL